MTPRIAIAALLVGSFAAGVWLFGPENGPSPRPLPAEVAAEPSAPPALPAPATPEPEAAKESPPPGVADPTATGSAAPDPSEGNRLRAEADRLFSEGRAMEGIAAFRRAVEADPSARNHGDFGSLLKRLTALDEALVHLRRAAELDPDNPDRWIELANAYYLKVDPGAAWKAERRARKADPSLVLGWDHGVRVRRTDDSAPEPR